MKQNLRNKNRFTKILLFTLFLTSDNESKCSELQNLAIASGIAACGLASIYIYKTYFSNPNYEEIVKNSYNCLTKTQNYVPQIDILKQRFDDTMMANENKHASTGLITEQIAEQLIPAINQSNVYDYTSRLNRSLTELRKYKQLIVNAVNKLEKDNQTNMQSYEDLRQLYISTNNVIPKMEFLLLYVQKHDTFFELNRIGQKIAEKQHGAITLLVSYIEPQIRNELKAHARKLYRTSNYPYLDFASSLNKDISDLIRGIAQLKYRYPELLKMANDLKNKLVLIEDLIVTDREYYLQKEKFKEDKEKQEKDRKETELKEREVKAREREAAAREREALAREREAKARERELENRRIELMQQQALAKQNAALQSAIQRNLTFNRF